MGPAGIEPATSPFSEERSARTELRPRAAWIPPEIRVAAVCTGVFGARFFQGRNRRASHRAGSPARTADGSLRAGEYGVPEIKVGDAFRTSALPLSYQPDRGSWLSGI